MRPEALLCLSLALALYQLQGANGDYVVLVLNCEGLGFSSLLEKVKPRQDDTV